MSITHLETSRGDTTAFVAGDMVVPGQLGETLAREKHPDAYPSDLEGPVIDAAIEVGKFSRAKNMSRISIVEASRS